MWTAHTTKTKLCTHAYGVFKHSLVQRSGLWNAVNLPCQCVKARFELHQLLWFSHKDSGNNSSHKQQTRATQVPGNTMRKRVIFPSHQHTHTHTHTHTYLNKKVGLKASRNIDCHAAIHIVGVGAARVVAEQLSKRDAGVAVADCKQGCRA